MDRNNYLALMAENAERAEIESRLREWVENVFSNRLLWDEWTDGRASAAQDVLDILDWKEEGDG
jgi:hypothetical protein